MVFNWRSFGRCKYAFRNHFQSGKKYRQFKLTFKKISLLKKNIYRTVLAGFTVLLFSLLFTEYQKAAAILIGYFLGLSAVLAHLLFIKQTKHLDVSDFQRLYFISILIRFLLICLIFVALIIFTKIDELGFTVSFIISYIFHSVIEIILLNKQLTSQNEER